MQLTVYKASAGSGKTYRLAVEYIKLLIENPLAYRQTLAVTFTNKATEEMKQRILSKLYGMWQGTEDAESYVKTICKETGRTPEDVRQRAGEALHSLVHNYQYFRVETIDSFFQQILRNLARELKLSNNIRLQLDDKEVMNQAVDQLVDELDEHSQTLSWIVDVVEESLAEGKTWKVIDKIKSFGKNIFSDAYRQHEGELDIDFVAYRKNLLEVIRQAQTQMQQYADRFQHILDTHQLSLADFSNNKSGGISYLLKINDFDKNDDKNIMGSRVQEAFNDFATLLRAQDRKASSPIYQVVEQEIYPLMQEAEKHRPAAVGTVKTATTILRALSRLRLLTTIRRQMEAMGKEANLFLLSDTQSMLSRLIGDSDSPFIFEKIGTQFKNIMIDEFQDTSTNQWRNFKVLLDECMSHGDSRNLIVGDVKQSIYRWRNGDWRLLNNIEQFFPNKEISVTPLDNNYRSAPEIVHFNNHFFKVAVECEQADLAARNIANADELARAYDELHQEAFASQRKGLVNFYFLENKTPEDVLLKQFCDDLCLLVEKGVALKQMAILARDGGSIKKIVNYMTLEHPELPLITEEAFILESSVAVGMMMDALRLVVNPENQLALATLSKAYQKHILQVPFNENQLIGINHMDLLPADFKRFHTVWASLPLYELAEQIYLTFSLATIENESAYMATFFDGLQKFLNDFQPDIERFLKYWEETLHKKSIQSDVPNGIRIMTIHKSKGLEFDHVFCPLCDWELEKRDDIWMESTKEPFNALPIVPVTYAPKELSTTIFAQQSAEEHLQNIVDNLNLLYVMFTRPRCSLFVYTNEKIEKLDNRRSKIYPTVLRRVQSEIPSASLVEESIAGYACTHFTLGSLQQPNEQKEPSAAVVENVFEQQPEPLSFPMVSYPTRARFLQSNASRQFIEAEETADDEQQMSYIQEGCILHALFARIHTKADIPAAIRELQQSGVMANHPKLTERFLQFITARLESQKVASWFSDDWKIFNECTILKRNPLTGIVEERRPDRVMQRDGKTVVVDFKFGNPQREHLYQVKEYVALLRQMGQEQVEGYLWYVYSNEIVNVEDAQ